ncbi:MAG: hypothetical protein AVDCRST_MAG64-1512 [uncultured Phycisphaerae bacterium]|uniref:Outer membrane lipoprotein-sorting protein n=1 Tax=uncultured Phycisphaerae bacterium TaxID=904963 RepID=A0A6J4NQQ4_9BACT|nr:MAG: hypothetical protein AVDCRST_MAG64-1512 [uncultured Phycisphaerae bacterium]
MKHAPTVLALAFASILTGCGPRARVAAGGTAGPYTGPTQTMAEVVNEINANNGALPTLWARHYFEANLVDADGRRQFVNGEGVLLYKQPRGMRLVGTKAAAGNVFEIGSDEERYWLSMTPPNDRSRMWWGWYRNLGKPCVDTRSLPIRPDLVLQVLGVATIDTNFMAPPVPTMRFNGDPNADAYVFVWNVPLGDRWAAQKEIWYDRATKRPRLVVLFDDHGRVVLRARLLNHRRLEIDGVPPERSPEVARRYELFFPDTGSTMTFDLDEVAPERRGVPTRRGIAFPENPKVDEVIQLDEACAD